jgi:hypothetical protein
MVVDLVWLQAEFQKALDEKRNVYIEHATSVAEKRR